METTFNLKRRRDSGDTEKAGEKKQQKAKSPNQKKKNLSLSNPSNQHPNDQQEKYSPSDRNQKKKLPPPQRPAQIIPPPQHTPENPTKPPLSPTPPTLSPISPPKLLSRSQSATRDPQPSPSTSGTVQRSRSASRDVQQTLNSFYFCQDILESPTLDRQIKNLLKPLRDLKKVDQKDIKNPYLFEGAAMVTTFIRLAGNQTKELWQFIEEASRADMTLAEMEHDSLNEISSKCTNRVPIYVHPTFYRSLNLRFPYDVGGISRSS